MFSDPLTSMHTTRVAASPMISAKVPVSSVRPNTPHMPNATNDPSMKISPWAKLISSMIP